MGRDRGGVGPSVCSTVNAAGPQLHVAFDEAPDRLWGIISSRLMTSPVVVVGITGPVGSGKSTLARRLATHGAADRLATPPSLLSTDDYLPDYRAVDPLHRDLPEHADLALLAENLAALRAGRRATVPVWSFHTHRREGVREVAPTALVICEGIHALHGMHREHLDVRVFVDAPRAVRWARWEAIELQGQRGMGVQAARLHFETIAEPSFDLGADEYRRAAQVVVQNHGPDPAVDG